eukprot:TRINITY_DN11427_c0_g2_i1.p1 TRINITY_DN11427_c0_g2~~TRINITY_DN11427_c0_g2_i1.p1  ORF type:complete len:316 (+),score=47.32 TRINITY_DN11427_c0_g2_i1:126-950(+)
MRHSLLCAGLLSLRARAQESDGCVLYGCGGGYQIGRQCQCSSSCKFYGNCCPDFEAACPELARRSESHVVYARDSTAVYECGAALSRVIADEGSQHSCALLRQTGSVCCWGEGEFGRLGHGQVSDSPLPVRVLGLVDAVAATAGGQHSCAVEREGDVKCWGAGEYGQLGHGGFSRGTAARLTVDLGPASDVSAGGSHTCALERSGVVQCWGWGEHGQLGDGRAKSSRYPVPVRGLGTVVAVSSGALHTCAVEDGGSVRCWVALAAKILDFSFDV